MTLRKPRGSVVIPAYNEAGSIGRCLRALFTGLAPGELEVVVVCNGCRDQTATVARATGLPTRVLELTPASKPAALRLGDATATAFPRLYLDADVVLPGQSALRVLERLHAGAVAARPPIRYDASRSSAPVRRYYRARGRIPAVLGSLWGAGVYGLSAAGRDRFDTFPDVVADDLWLDRQFAHDEVEIVDCAPVVVTVPRRTADLVRILRRTYRGKAEHHSPLNRDARSDTITRSTLHDLGRLAAAGGQDALDAATYGAFAAGARFSLMLAASAGAVASAGSWERDESSRSA